MIATLRRMLSSALGRDEPTGARRARGGRRDTTADDAEHRIDDARRRLKATIPPPED